MRWRRTTRQAERVSHSKACEIEDFRDPDLVWLIRDMFAHDVRRFGPDFPAGREWRKYWEVAMAARSLRDHGALGARATILGVGAGAENTLFWLTRHATVHATDLYLSDDDWNDSSNAEMLRRPEDFYPDEWNPRRLVLQHMDGRELRYEDQSFDGVFSSGSLEHFGEFEDARRGIEEIHRVLRPGGIAAISTELRLEGPPPGLPGVLMFDREQIGELLSGLGWTLIGPASFEISPATRAAAVPFADAAADVRAHTAQYGRLRFDTLEWTRYPQIVLTEDALTWTSVHLTLRRD